MFPRRQQNNYPILKGFVPIFIIQIRKLLTLQLVCSTVTVSRIYDHPRRLRLKLIYLGKHMTSCPCRSVLDLEQGILHRFHICLCVLYFPIKHGTG